MMDTTSGGLGSKPPAKVDGVQTEKRSLLVPISFILPAVLVVGLLVLLISIRGDLETAMANLARLLPVGYAFAAGMVASVNPCGVIMLSTYAFYQLREEGERPSMARQAARSVLVAATATAGFVAVFGVVGGIITISGQWLVSIFPLTGVVIGAAMVILGVWLLLTRKSLGIAALATSRQALVPRRTLGNIFVFGIAYAAASLSCTLPIFLVVVGSAIASDNLLISFGQFLGYALGMGTVILIVTIGAALFRRAMARWLRTLTPHVYRLNAMFLIGAGMYLLYYWIFQSGTIP